MGIEHCTLLGASLYYLTVILSVHLFASVLRTNFDILFFYIFSHHHPLPPSLVFKLRYPPCHLYISSTTILSLHLLSSLLRTNFDVLLLFVIILGVHLLPS